MSAPEVFSGGRQIVAELPDGLRLQVSRGFPNAATPAGMV
jgi:hypothetical protein